MRWRHALMILLAAAALVGWWMAWHEHRARNLDGTFEARRVALLTGENARLTALLAQQLIGREMEAGAAQRREIEKTVASIRDLPFTRPISYKEIPRSELPKILQQKLFQQMPGREFDDAGVALTALGLLPAGTDLKKTYLSLLGEQIGAFYDQHTREVFTFSGQPLSIAQNRVILAHELTHALEDQHFHLDSLPLEAKGNDDRTLAASALVEGDATLVMNRYMLGNLSGAVLKESLASAFTTDIRQLAAAPRFLRETLLFPYLKGQVFCTVLYEQGGWNALAEAFRHPPECTAQIIHPERFLSKTRWEPVAVEFPAKTVLGQTPLVDNVLGEFGVAQLLRIWSKGQEMDGLAAEWAGDRYMVFGDARTNSYVWQSIWSSNDAAERFALATRNGWQACNGNGSNALPPPTDFAPVKVGEFAMRPSSGRELRIIQNNRTVLLIDAQDSGWADAMVHLFAPVKN